MSFTYHGQSKLGCYAATTGAARVKVWALNTDFEGLIAPEIISRRPSGRILQARTAAGQWRDGSLLECGLMA